ncbi:MAG: BamA/TamA family outer membrane protein [Saprospiraceae bacterium]|nr:BamA/TamA family outer membrane protein [Saprospiraceae bacterium]MCF8249220.1 BamA/TamA family outer membrane protein [Saprospiraceae bacterium]MCF8280173.1 BamA/TamA family outer membrane protein [Bacteroidales bacterium]MCF8311349.1 BamA/TamA family outer membrane protein [Saprospiraceae bacterium]MCF8440087.1 BamA/TamA family outer membrane protein [Saprospiraceae bacterium]
MNSFSNIKPIFWTLLVANALLFSSCTGALLLPKGEQLYTGAKLKVEKADKSWETAKMEASMAQDIVLPRPNRHILWLRINVGIYNTFHNPNKEKGFRNWVAEKLGTPPILYDPSIAAIHQQLLTKTAANYGFFKVNIESKPKGFWKKKKLKHTVHLLDPPKVMSNLTFPPDTGIVEHRLLELKASTLLQDGLAYQLDLLKLERQRLTDSLRNEGWYYLSPDDLIFEADTLQSDTVVRLALRFKDDVTDKDKRRYRIGEILVFPDYDIQNAGQGQRMEQVDDCISFIFTETSVKKKVITANIPFRCGEYFSNEKYRTALFRLQNLGFFKFVNIRFEPSMLADSLLEAHVLLTPALPQKVEAKLSGLYSPGLYGGAEAGLTWQHRNTFGAAENLRLSWAGSYLDFGLSSGASDFSQLFSSEAAAQLTVPQNMFGFRSQKSNALAATRFSFRHKALFFDLKLNAYPSFRLGLQRLEGEGGFVWKKNRQGSVSHELNPLNASLQYTSIAKPGLKSSLLAQIPDDDSGDLLFLATQVEFRPNYTFVFDNRLTAKGKVTNYFRQRFTLRGSGYLLPKAVADAANLGYPLNFFTESDWRQYRSLSDRTIFAYRLSVFAGLRMTPKSTFSVLDLYTIGGASSVRAFAPRIVGPGSEPLSDVGIGLSNHTGNLQFQAAAELRQKLGEMWELAAFLDAGNIWLTKSDPDLPGGEFSANDFYKELASGTGLGLRFSLGFFILRFDVAVPLSKPYLPLGSRMIGQTGFKEGQFLGGLRGNFAFGYPF